MEHSDEEISAENFIEYLDEKGLIDKEKDVVTDLISGNKIITLEDGYVYEMAVGEDGSFNFDYAGIGDEIVPRLAIATSSGTNKITIFACSYKNVSFLNVSKSV